MKMQDPGVLLGNAGVERQFFLRGEKGRWELYWTNSTGEKVEIKLYSQQYRPESTITTLDSICSPHSL